MRAARLIPDVKNQLSRQNPSCVHMQRKRVEFSALEIYEFKCYDDIDEHIVIKGIMCFAIMGEI